MGLRLGSICNNLEHKVGVVASLFAIDYVQELRHVAYDVFLFVCLCCLCVVL
jgi:hypothetical protein